MLASLLFRFQWSWLSCKSELKLQSRSSFSLSLRWKPAQWNHTLGEQDAVANPMGAFPVKLSHNYNLNTFVHHRSLPWVSYARTFYCTFPAWWSYIPDLCSPDVRHPRHLSVRNYPMFGLAKSSRVMKLVQLSFGHLVWDSFRLYLIES